QIRSAERRGVTFSNLYWRRLFGLFALGALHGAFFFEGDILAIYAILGSALFLFRNASSETLLRAAIGLYMLQLVIFATLAGLIALGASLAPDEMAIELSAMEENAERARLVFGEGSFLKVAEYRFGNWTEVLGYGLFMQGIGALAFFLFGFAAVRLNTIAAPSARFWRRSRGVYLPIGILGSLWSAHIMAQSVSFFDPNMMLGLFLIVLFSPFSTAGYLGLIAKWAERPMGKIKLFLARGGTSSLTAYLLQSAILSFIFCGYGFGLYGKLGAATCIAIGLAVGVFSIIFTSLWRATFAQGPMEMLLRLWTYWGRKPRPQSAASR
ncbi:MAG: DUF418 domain-containing protein, partial [Pseudomonadota bacterium]